MLDRLTILRCKAANAYQLAECHLDEARRYERMADDEAALAGRTVPTLPDDWQRIAEMDLPAKRAATGVPVLVDP